MSNLLEMLIADPQSRLHYIRYKVQVEHRRPSDKLLENLPIQIAMELTKLYHEETAKWLRKQKKHDPTG